jgi:hypothetical protein
MTTVRIKGFKIFKDRHGRMRCYHRETGQKIDLVKAPLGSAAFFAECEKITAIAEAKDPILMARAMKLAVESGRLAYRAGRMGKRRYADPSSPLAGLI